MKLDEIVAWYQEKIGTYDKQQWEKTVEQKILDGFSSVKLKTAKLKTELIDMDLVRGSTFPKAKPKQTLLTVIRLAILRYFFLPIYAQWWVRQTSPNIFALLLFLYITQMVNWALYTLNVHRLEHNAAAALGTDIYINATLNPDGDPSPPSDGSKRLEEHIVSLADLLIPMTLSLVLSLIHSQIVATNTASGAKAKRRRYSNTNSQGGKIGRGEPRLRRRRKLVKMRNQDITTLTSTKKLNPIVEVGNDGASFALPKLMSSIPQSGLDACAPNISICRNPSYAAKLKLNLGNTTTTNNASSSTFFPDVDECSEKQELPHKKRNVNWHTPIENYAIETQDRQQQTTPQCSSGATTTTSECGAGAIGLGSSYSHSTSKSSSSSNNNSASVSPSKTVRIDVCVQEFYDDLISRTESQQLATSSIQVVDGAGGKSATASDTPNRNGFITRRTIGEDDGFESLNGKSSSGEETNSPLQTTSLASVVTKNELRLRLNNTSAVKETELRAPVPSIGTGTYRRKVPLSSESENDKNCVPTLTCDAYQQTKKQAVKRSASASSDETEEEGDDGETVSSPASLGNNYNECTTSTTEWLGITTNSEECSYSSEFDNSDEYKNHQTDEDGYDLDITPTTILYPHGTTDRISCTVWEQREIKKAPMTVLEISSCIIERVEAMPETNDYIYMGICFSVLLSFVPSFCRLCEVTIDSDKLSEINYFDVPMLLWEKASFSFWTLFRFAFGQTVWERAVLIIGFLQRLCLTTVLFIIFAVAERTFKQRFLYAKLFSHLTSSRRARKSNLPHFRLNKVRNIKTWLSVRSFLKKRGPQRSVDVIVSAAFLVTLLLLAFLSVEWLKDSVRLHSHLNLEALMWATTIGIYLLRYMTLGNKIHHKYRSVSVLITEQINLYLQIEQKPKKKEELMVANSVLKLASDLLKELETPFKISGLSANPFLFTTIKVVILSALSGVLSEMLGFKLKLHKIKIK